MKRLVVLVGIAAAHGAEARPTPPGGGWLHYELSVVHAVEGDGEVPSELVLVATRMHAYLGGPYVGIAGGFDLAVGATIGAGGLAYEAAAFPAGVALRIGPSGFFVLAAGGGVSGAVGTLDDALTVPAEATFELGGAQVRVMARLRASWVFLADARQRGAMSMPWIDELEGTAGVRIGKQATAKGYSSGNGYFVGVGYREWLGARSVGLVIGYSIDGGSVDERPAHEVARR